MNRSVFMIIILFMDMVIIGHTMAIYYETRRKIPDTQLGYCLIASFIFVILRKYIWFDTTFFIGLLYLILFLFFFKIPWKEALYDTLILSISRNLIFLCITDSNLNHTGIYLYSKGKIMIHLTFDYQSDEGCTTPGQYLRYHRTFQGLTTRELAEKVGVVPATLVLYENDRHPIKHSTAVALANVLGIDRSRLLDEYTVFVDYPYSSLLKKVRRELSFTQMQMAEVIGIGQTTYSGWEREVRVPRRKEHEKILAAMKKLKVDVDTYLCQPNPL